MALKDAGFAQKFDVDHDHWFTDEQCDMLRAPRLDELLAFLLESGADVSLSRHTGAHSILRSAAGFSLDVDGELWPRFTDHDQDVLTLVVRAVLHVLTNNPTS